MRLRPAQIAIRLICGEQLPRVVPGDATMQECIRKGRLFLIQITGENFGYDLQAWHDHLKESRQDGYTYGRNIVLPKIMLEAMASEKWRAARDACMNEEV